VVTAIEKEYHDSRVAQLENQKYHRNNVTIRYGSGESSDSEKGAAVEGLNK